jgi:acetyltransferase-like isoleucine patch superfamily enzyme
MLTKTIAKAADIALKLPDWVSAKLRTLSARRQAVLGQDCRVLSDGRILNILNDQAHINIGNHVRIRGEILTFAHSGRIRIGDWFYCGPGSRIWSSDPDGIRIGNRVLVAPGVLIYDTNSHPMDPLARFSLTRAIFCTGHPREIEAIRSAPVVIGDDVWLATGVTVLKGVKIGDRAVIGAGSIICSDVEADALIPAGTVLRRGYTT